MAARINLRQQDFYVYRIFDGFETVYVGKGSGRRLKHQQRNFGCEGEVIERCTSDDHAFERERYWIAELRPTANKHPGGNGGRCRKRAKPRDPKWLKEIDAVGPRRYAARALLRLVDERNCERLGVSKVDISRLREVAIGPRC